jgi:hypothetical protein
MNPSVIWWMDGQMRAMGFGGLEASSRLKERELLRGVQLELIVSGVASEDIHEPVPHQLCVLGL